MLKLSFILPVVFLMLAITPAGATNWCRKPGGGADPCPDIPENWVNCGPWGGGTMWCPPSGNMGRSRNKGNTNTALVVVGGVAFVGIMWYIFKKPQSSHFAGQVRLMEF